MNAATPGSAAQPAIEVSTQTLPSRGSIGRSWSGESGSSTSGIVRTSTVLSSTGR